MSSIIRQGDTHFRSNDPASFTNPKGHARAAKPSGSIVVHRRPPRIAYLHNSSVVANLGCKNRWAQESQAFERALAVELLFAGHKPLGMLSEDLEGEASSSSGKTGTA